MDLESWDEIRTAYQVARLGTVSGAAEVLGVHHATVIRHIDALERRLGAKLFQRHARGYAPTEAGRDLLATAQRTDEQLGRLVGRIKGQSESVTGELIVTTVTGMSGLLVPVFRDFLDAHPGVTIRHLSDQRLFRMDQGEAHVALRAGARPEEADYVVQPLVTMHMALFASAEYVARWGKPESPAEFARHRFIGAADLESRVPFNRWMQQHVPAEAIAHRVSEIGSVNSAVIGGLGIGFMRLPDAKAAGMIEILPSRPEWDAPLWLVTHVDLHRSLKVQSFLAALKRAAATWDCRK